MIQLSQQIVEPRMPVQRIEFRVNARTLAAVVPALLLTGVGLALVDAPDRAILLPVAVVVTRIVEV